MGHVVGGKQLRLWAYYLSFEHPVTHEKLVFEDIPNSF